MPGVTFIDDCEWSPMCLPVFGGGGYDLDSARVPWHGRVDKKVAFLATLKRFQPLSQEYPQMFLASIDDDQDPVFPTITLNYTGFRVNGGNGIPPAKGVDSSIVSVLSVISTGFDSLGLGPLQFTGNYLVPRTTWTWYANTTPNPTLPQYRTARGGISPLSTLYNCTTPNGTPVSPAVAIKYASLGKLKTKSTISDYQKNDVIPGKVWQCSCTVDLFLVGP